MKKKRNKIILVGILSLTACSQPKQEKVVVDKEVEASPEPEISDVRKELEKLYEERGTKNQQTDTQIFLLTRKYKIPLFEDSPKEYPFDERMDLYLTKMQKLAEEKGEYDFLYNAISDHLIWDYQTYKKELSEKDSERFLEIIKLCKKRLRTAIIWGEETEEEL